MGIANEVVLVFKRKSTQFFINVNIRSAETLRVNAEAEQKNVKVAG